MDGEPDPQLDPRPDAAPAPAPQGEPDYRMSLAAERTYLAYLRTGLALSASGVAVASALPDAGATEIRRGLGIALIVLAGLVFAYARLRLAAITRAMREGRPLPALRFPRRSPSPWSPSPSRP